MSWLSDAWGSIFGGGKKNKQVAADVAMPYQDPSISNVRKNLEDIIAQRGLGYTPSFVNASVAPYAQGERAAFSQIAIPEISAQASARGLGRSTIPVNRIAMERGNLENRIGQRAADIGRESEQLKASQYSDALSRLAGIGQLQLNAQDRAAAEAAQVTNANRAAQLAANQGSALFLSQMTSPFLSEGLKSIFGKTKTTTPAGDISEKPYQFDFIKAMDASLGNPSSMVKLAKSSDSDTLTAMLKLLSGVV